MVLTTLIDIDGQMGWVLLLTPIVVLAVIVIGVIAGRDRRTPDFGPESKLVPSPSAAMRDKTTASPTPLTPRANDQLQPSASDVCASARESGPPVTVTGGAVESPAPLDTPQTKAELTASPVTSKAGASAGITASEIQLLEAERRFDDAAVARLSLQLARDLMSSSRPDEVVKSHLRRAIILASRLKDNDTHAAARLELGDLMARESDLTSACEHWQIARQIFWDHGAKEQQAEVDQRMMANHCPTDWVLNDF